VDLRSDQPDQPGTYMLLSMRMAMMPRQAGIGRCKRASNKCSAATPCLQNINLTLVAIRKLELTAQKACADNDWRCMYCLQRSCPAVVVSAA